ncbi:hypothetical protein SAMN05216241_10397 [Limimonas halophila]|uniref:Uncharacterized protein n=1 Tax=Limimonas halophila TaxID=1082479 RepID=A0A1G7PVY6_9PROT|nr:hypothetical protein [Limimonas halophila]SDF90418.1 hypothetical protein SAMN05216241_10397 [Limimonas halophila]
MRLPGSLGQNEQVNTVLRQLQNLVQRPQIPDQSVPETRPNRQVGGGQPDAGTPDPATQQERPFDPAERAARAAEAGRILPRGSFVDLVV